MPAADLTTERIRFEAALPLEGSPLPPGPYLISGKVEAGGAVLGAFVRIPRFHFPCPHSPCAAVVQAEVPFKNVTEALLGAFIDGKLTARFDASFTPPGGGEARRLSLPLSLSPASLELDGESLTELAQVESVSLDAPAGGINLRFLFMNPFPFSARLEKMDLKVRLGTRNAYPLAGTPDLDLPPGETVHEEALKLKAEDLLLIASRKVVTEQYDLGVEAKVTGTLSVKIAGRTVELSLPE